MNKKQQKAIEVTQRKQARQDKKAAAQAEREMKQQERAIQKLTKMLTKESLKQAKTLVREEAKAQRAAKKEADKTLRDTAAMFRTEERIAAKKKIPIAAAVEESKAPIEKQKRAPRKNQRGVGQKTIQRQAREKLIASSSASGIVTEWQSMPEGITADQAVDLASSKEDARTVSRLHLVGSRRDDKTNDVQEIDAFLSPHEAKKWLSAYGFLVMDARVDMWYTLHVPLVAPMQGACDFKQHSVTMGFQGPDGELVQIKTRSIKSKDDNCLLVAMASVSEDKTRAHTLRKELGLADGPISTDQCNRIAERLGVTYAVYRMQEQRAQVICESDTVSAKHINLLVKDDHYWIIDSDMSRTRSVDLGESMQIQKKQEDAEQVCDKVVTTEEHDDDVPLEQIRFLETLTDPSTEQVIDIVQQGKNLLIVGPGGTGKTYMLKHIPDAIMTATTANAAEIIGGSTIHMYMTKNRKVKGARVVIDEVSMMGSVLFEEVWQWAGCKNQLILSGDFLQLPPVNDRFFFQSSSFYEFAAKTVLVKLTIVKRQENRDQAKFLNDLREGIIDKAYLMSLTRNTVRNPELVLASKRDFVDEYNASKLKELGSCIVNYEITITKGTRVKTRNNRLAAGCSAIITKNSKEFFNGQRVTVISTQEDTVTIRTEHGIEKTIGYIEDVDGDRKERYIPVEACYALTIHKSQGQTVKSCVVHVDGLFEQGMAYVALSRCTDLRNVQIRDKINLSDKGWQPNTVALEFYNTGRTCPADQLLFISNTRKQLKNIIKKRWEPLEKKLNAIYIDFETYLVGAVQKPYYNKILHIRGGEKVHEQSLFDERWNNGIRCDVGADTWSYIRNEAVRYGDDMQQLKKDPKKLGIVRAQRKLCPTIIGYNLSGFDLHFLMQKYLQDDVCSRRFKLQTIYKGTSLIFFQVFDRLSQEIVLKTHDMFQFFMCSLAAALRNFCGSEGKKQAEKIEFKDEILHIMQHYDAHPEILMPSVETSILKRVYSESGITDTPIGKTVRLYDEVIRYADNDVDVLPMLYESVDALCHETFDANCTDFLTAGSMAWYGAITNLPEQAYQKSKRDKHRHAVSTKLNTKLYRMERLEEDFVRKSIKGGRVCPRIHQVQNEKLVYLDISGMYASIMANELLPYGRASWLDDAKVKILSNTVNRCKTRNWRHIFDAITKAFGLFVCEVDFQENSMNLEPIVQFKDENGKTRWTLERRTDVLTSIDLSLIVASGGKVHSINRVLRWEQNGPIMKQWIEKTLAIKKQGEITGNAAKKSFGKLLANSAYGQTLKRDQNDVTTVVSCWEQSDAFVTQNRLRDIFTYGDFSVMKGEKIQQQDQFVTSRCSFLGSFILGYTRGMVHEIVEIACPNRYSEAGINEQPIYGDTDSLVFREWQANRLVEAGWIQKLNGKLTDELTDDKAHWFLPERLKEHMPAGSIAQQQDWIWNNAYEAEKRDPCNFRFSYATHFLASAPKSYACKTQNHDGSKTGEKIKFKGIPQSALVDGKRLDFERVGIAYEHAGQSKAVLQGSLRVLKTFTKKEGSMMFSQILDSNIRSGKPIVRTLFKTVWQGRKHLEDSNITVPWGWGA